MPHRVPDVIFEFVSQDRSDQERDYIDKRAEYHAIRVREYVIVDRFKQPVLVPHLETHRLCPACPHARRALHHAAAARPEGLAGRGV